MPSMTKKQLKEALDEQGIEYPEDATNRELEKMLYSTPETEEEESEEEEEDVVVEDPDEEEETEEEEEKEEEEEEEEEEEQLGPVTRKDTMKYNGKGSIDIVRGTKYIRTYHEEAHGKDFKKLAKKFINKNTDPKTKKTAFKMVNTESIERVRVEYTELTKKGMEKKVAKFGGDITEKERALDFAHGKNVGVVIDL